MSDPTAAEEDLPDIAFETFFDTAGTERDPHVLATTGVILTFDNFLGLEAAWKSVLADYGICCFHMSEFAHFKGDFAGWKADPTRRTALLSRLIAEAGRWTSAVMVQVLALSHFRLVDAQYQITEAIGGPYSLTQLLAIRRTLGWIGTYAGRTGVNVLLEAGDNGQAAMMGFLERTRQFTPTLLTKRDTESGNWTPLQLADLIAYEYRKWYEERVQGYNRVPEQLRKSLRAIQSTLTVSDGITTTDQIVEFCQHFGIPRR